MTYQVLDEILHVPPDKPQKALCLHKLKFADDGRIEFRLCYYVIGHKGRTKGKWVFGQYAPMMRTEEFEAIIEMARKKGWIS